MLAVMIGKLVQDLFMWVQVVPLQTMTKVLAKISNQDISHVVSALRSLSHDKGDGVWEEGYFIYQVRRWSFLLDIA